MPPVIFSPGSPHAILRKAETMKFPVRPTNSLLRRRDSLFAAEQGIACKALAWLREMTVRLAKTVKKGQKFANFPVLFPVFREFRPTQRGRGLGFQGVNSGKRLV
jgi:hypothetical protein